MVHCSARGGRGKATCPPPLWRCARVSRAEGGEEAVFTQPW